MSDAQAVRILHVTPQLTLGGAGRALVALAKYSALQGNFRHRAISLSKPDPGAVRLASEAQLEVRHMMAASSDWGSELGAADILQVHFWNHPALREFYDRVPWHSRTIVWCHTNCREPPHILTNDVFNAASLVLMSSPGTLDVSMSAKTDHVQLLRAGADFDRLSGLRSAPHDTFNVGYIGLYDFVKLHKDFAALSAALSMPNVRVLAYGEGREKQTIMRQAEQLGASGRIVIRPYLHDLREALAQFDVFGYPLCEDNAATSELVLQEVMRAGIPPVVLHHGSPAELVVHGETGLVARDGADYVRQIEFLYHNPAERLRLGSNASRYAGEVYGADNSARHANAIYASVLGRPGLSLDGLQLGKHLGDSSPTSGARSLIASLGHHAGDFIASIDSRDESEVLAADRRIGQVKKGMGDAILMYRSYYQDDPYLRLWNGLVLMNGGHMALAASEFKACLDRDNGSSRSLTYLAEATRGVGSQPFVHRSGTVVRN
jgi:glycosyltransferase involved in cell wall biosynthesis